MDIKHERWRIETICVKIHPSLLLDRIAVEPTAEVRAMEAALVGEHSGLAVEILRTESEIELIRHRAIVLDDIAVGIVDVLSGDRAGFRHVAHDVAVVVITGDEEDPIDGYGKKSTDSSRTLLRAGQVIAPEVLTDTRRAVREGDPLEDGHAIVNNIAERTASAAPAFQ